jgi:hypothetical protein
MPDFDLEQLERFVEPLAALFYLLMLVAFVTAIVGSPGTGFFFLILGAAAQVGRASIEGLSASRGFAASRASGAARRVRR